MIFVLKNVIAGLLAIAFILNTVGFFTSGWIQSTNPINFGPQFVNMTSLGIIPYRTEITDQFPWFGVSSIFLIFTFILYLLSAPLCAFVWMKSQKHGLSRNTRAGFGLLAVMSLVIFLFTIISVIIIGVYLHSFNTLVLSYRKESVYVGYSAWLCIASAALMTGVFGISFFISYNSYE